MGKKNCQIMPLFYKIRILFMYITHLSFRAPDLYIRIPVTKSVILERPKENFFFTQKNANLSYGFKDNTAGTVDNTLATSPDEPSDYCTYLHVHL